MSKIDIKAMKAEVKAKNKADKQPRTVQVKTIVITLVVIFLMVFSFMGGWFVKCADQARVESAASSLVQTLKSQK
jgi:hypothetical protein